MLILDGINNLNKNTSLIKDVGVDNFALEVIEASNEKIVLVDFWAPWCGPCKQLAPILEKAAIKHQGKLIITKINIDENAELAAQLRIQTIPTVYAFFRGQPIDAFMGNVSEQKLDQFLSKLFDLTKIPSSLNLEEALKQAMEFFDKSLYEDAAKLYVDILTELPEEEKAAAGLAHCYLFLNHEEKAKEILKQIPTDKQQTRQAIALLSHLELIQEIDQMQLSSSSNASEQSYQNALKSFRNREIKKAIQELLEINRIDKDWNNGVAKDMLLRIFSALGHSHHLTAEGRRKLSAILFS
ncbi:MAG: thioredoxin [Alphaproteobacteria bacterium]|nr:thioredoxin [Alphaproteobacteria bacterium]